MPDISLIKPLCEALSISINELLSGERIITGDFEEIAEENIINTLNYSENRIHNIKKIFIIAIISIFTVLVTLSALFGIDVARMRDNKPVLFSTWGFDYAPPIDLKDEEIQLSVKDYLVGNGDNEKKHEEGVKTFVAFKTYLIEELTAETRYNVYAWVLQEQCYIDKNDIMNYGSYSIPFKFTVEKQDDKFVVTESRQPRDGSYYSEDMKKLFPKSVISEMDKLHTDGTFERLQLQIEEQIKLYFHKDY